jgi:hypothetical protein
MKTNLQIKLQALRRPVLTMVAFVLTMSGILPALLLGTASAVAQVQSRSIKLSDSRPSATAVKYTVQFNVATTGTIQGVDVDFCGGGASDTPIIGDSNCSIPTGMSLTGVAVTSPVTGLSPTTGWTASVINSSHTVEISNASGASVSSGATVTFELTGITNPSATLISPNSSTFYARILTFTTPALAAAYTSGTPGTYVDYGGAAISIAQAVNITAKVMETLTFCVSGSSITNCGTTTAPNVNLGAAVGSNFVLDSAAVYTANAFTQTSTNAVGGVAVRLKTTSSTTCAGLSSDSGATCAKIPAVASGATTPTTITAGTAAFGMCVTPGTANTTATVPYNSAGCTQYGMDDTSATKTWSTYGSQIFSSSGPVSQENDTLKYAATASATTPAGIYTSTQSVIATGTF